MRTLEPDRGLLHLPFIALEVDEAAQAKWDSNLGQQMIQISRCLCRIQYNAACGFLRA
jgi:hypothetical protein